MGQVRELLFGVHDPYENLELLPPNNHGWASEDPAYKEFIDIVNPKLIVEVGTWMGGSARALTRTMLEKGEDDFEVVCIDTFLGSFEHWDKTSYLMSLKNGRPNIYEQFLSNTVYAGYQKWITPFPVDAQNGFLTFQKMNIVPDLVYIDAGHDYYSVVNDLSNWASILPNGGAIIGDDWHHPPIKRAVADVFGMDKIHERGAKFAWIK